MATRGQAVRALRLVVHPTRDGCIVVLLGAEWSHGGRRDREYRRVTVDLGDPLCMDDPGAALMALSDALADLADTYRH